MTVRKAVLHDLHTSIAGAIARDPGTGDWLIAMSPRMSDPGYKRVVFNSLMAQLDSWERNGSAGTAEVRQYLRQMMG